MHLAWLLRSTWPGLLCLFLSGCLSSGHPGLADEGTMSQIQVGVTTRQQVERLLGEPDGRRLTELGGGKLEWWSYSYATAAINPIDYLLLYGFLYNGIGLYDTRHDLHVFFDRHDRVSSWSRLKTDYEMGRPFGSGRIASVSTRMVGFPEAAKDPVLFEDRMEHRFE